MSKPTYTKLYRESIGHLWKRYERSLLSSEATTEHRLAIQPKKTKKKTSAVGPSDWDEAVDAGEDRRVPSEAFVNPALFWAIGDGSVELYKPPGVRVKLKTQKRY